MKKAIITFITICSILIIWTPVTIYLGLLPLTHNSFKMIIPFALFVSITVLALAWLGFKMVTKESEDESK